MSSFQLCQYILIVLVELSADLWLQTLSGVVVRDGVRQHCSSPASSVGTDTATSQLQIATGIQTRPLDFWTGMRFQCLFGTVLCNFWEHFVGFSPFLHIAELVLLQSFLASSGCKGKGELIVTKSNKQTKSGFKPGHLPVFYTVVCDKSTLIIHHIYCQIGALQTWALPISRSLGH